MRSHALGLLLSWLRIKVFLLYCLFSASAIKGIVIGFSLKLSRFWKNLLGAILLTVVTVYHSGSNGFLR